MEATDLRSALTIVESGVPLPSHLPEMNVRILPKVSQMLAALKIKDVLYAIHEPDSVVARHPRYSRMPFIGINQGNRVRTFSVMLLDFIIMKLGLANVRLG